LIELIEKLLRLNDDHFTFSFDGRPKWMQFDPIKQLRFGLVGRLIEIYRIAATSLFDSNEVTGVNRHHNERLAKLKRDEGLTDNLYDMLKIREMNEGNIIDKRVLASKLMHTDLGGGGGKSQGLDIEKTIAALDLHKNGIDAS
jgi:hypothetical protein